MLPKFPFVYWLHNKRQARPRQSFELNSNQKPRYTSAALAVNCL